MSKAVLVIDMPEKCLECPMLNDYTNQCILQDEDANFKADTWEDLKQNCPLAPMPEKMEICGKYNAEYYAKGGKPPSYKVGWNDCRKAIGGD